MIQAVFFLAKWSVFEMLWLESDIQQKNATFIFASVADIDDWKNWWRLVLNSAFFQLVCNFDSKLQCKADLPVFFTFCLPVL